MNEVKEASKSIDKYTEGHLLILFITCFPVSFGFKFLNSLRHSNCIAKNLNSALSLTGTGSVHMSKATLWFSHFTAGVRTSFLRLQEIKLNFQAQTDLITLNNAFKILQHAALSIFDSFLLSSGLADRRRSSCPYASRTGLIHHRGFEKETPGVRYM